jgi:primosomal protein N' (replication factor Y)
LKKKQVLLLLPEIAITTQIVQRIEKAIGGKVPVYHSKVSTTEKIRCWEGIQKEQISFVIGTRSALFLPFQYRIFNKT